MSARQAASSTWEWLFALNSWKLSFVMLLTFLYKFVSGMCAPFPCLPAVMNAMCEWQDEVETVKPN